MATRPAKLVASSVASKSAAHKSTAKSRAEEAAAAFLRRIHPHKQSALSAEPVPPRVSPRIARKRSSRFVAPDLNRHARKCQICRHPQRQSIEADFFDWCQASWIRANYGIATDKAIYNHARATGLDVLRRENLRLAAEKILERVDEIATPSALDIVRAVRTLACINERNQWVEPPKTRVIVYHTERVANTSMPQSAEPSQPELSSRNSQPQTGSVSSSRLPLSQTAVACSSPVACHSSLPSNRQTPLQSETNLTHTKQTPEPVSNRPKERHFSSELPPQPGSSVPEGEEREGIKFSG